ncbi:MAG: hypothetical protein R6V14_09445 [Halanaerobiales bacterium]
MSDTVKHVIVGDMIGTILAYFDNPVINNPFTAFSLGFASHALLDNLENDFVVNWFNISRLRYAFPFLMFQIIAAIILIWIFIYNNKKYSSKYTILRICAVVGAIIPDIIDGVYSIVNPAAWYEGKLLFPWHSIDAGAQDKIMSMHMTMIITVVFIIMRFLFYKYIFTKEVIYYERPFRTLRGDIAQIQNPD